MAAGKNILLVSYYFPPLGLGGVGRPYNLAKYLPQHGFNVHVITVKDVVYPGYDYAALDKLEKSRIYRTGSFDPARILYLLGKRTQKTPGFPKVTGKLPLYLPDLKRGWNYFAYRKARAVIKEHGIRLIITTSPPPSSHLIGLKLKKNTGVKWIADFRDFWFPLPIEKIYKQGFTRNYALRLKSEIVENADGVVAVNEDIQKYLGRGEVIYNGADEALAELWRHGADRLQERFTIGLFGTFNELVPLEPLLKAVRKLADSGREISLKHAGQIDALNIAKIKEYGLTDRFESSGYLPKSDAIRTLRDCDMFYLGLKDMSPYHILPGRIFELMMSGKPIVAVVPEESAAAKLLKNSPGGRVIADYSIDSIAEAILSLMNERELLKSNPEPDDIYSYSSHRMADQYAHLINDTV